MFFFIKNLCKLQTNKLTIYEKLGENKFSFKAQIGSVPAEKLAIAVNSVLSGKVLVLNQGYEPISVCSPRKAILLNLMMKAEILEVRKDMFIHTVSAKFPCPAVIKLAGYFKVPFRSIVLTKKNILKRDENCCQYCGSHHSDLTIDHIIPRSRGGTDSWENLVAACKTCNSRKGSRTPAEANMPLKKKPRKPNYVAYFKQYFGIADESWKQFLYM